MAFRASDDLRCYIRGARLPVMAYRSPRGGSGSSHLALNIRPERYRTLRIVHTINAMLFSDIISDWVEEFVPCKSLGVNDEDERTGERLTIPCEPFFSIVPLPLARAEDIERVFVWVDMFPLESIRRILNLLYVDSNSWKLLPCEEGPLLKTSTWSHTRGDQGKTIFSQHALCLFLMPPWVLSAKDLQEFARGQSFPDRTSSESLEDKAQSTLRGMEWLWSKVWDTCIHRNCRWFIVTTYTHWVFGVFSAGWTVSFVSPPYAFDSHTPTILEILVFWLVSAMGYPGGFVVPEIPYEVVHRRQLLVATPRDISRDEPAEALAVLAV
ncbi:hypothetical protein HD554DRAFT_1113745 [Boletus coccyginus]|nr:hypothetical protein HD554DRAFT_1113745 [Boletus coccyginus]